MKKQLFLIDNSALAYRSFYAFINNPLKNSQGQETSAIFGFVSHILRLIEESKPSHIALVQDLPGKTFRHEMYDLYKAQRKPMPDSLISQMPHIRRFVDVSGLKLIGAEGFEADDVIGTLATQAGKSGYRVCIDSRDKDLMQLVDDSVCLMELGKQNQPTKFLDAKSVEDKMGVPPGKIIDFLALTGDSSDNIPGVTKVGPKTACDLLQQYGDLEGIYANLDKITKKALKKNLENDREMAFLSKKLVTLDCAINLPCQLGELSYQGLQIDALKDFLDEFELHSLLRHLPGSDKIEIEGKEEKIEAPSCKYEIVDTEAKLDEVCEKLAKAPVVALDTETTHLDSMQAELVGICLSIQPTHGWYLPVGHDEGSNLSMDSVCQKLDKALMDPEKIVVFHNAKYDLVVLERSGLFNPSHPKFPKLADTLIAAHLVNPGVRGLSLDDLAVQRFGLSMVPITELIGKGKKQKKFSEVPIDQACQYAAEDADFTLRLWQTLEPELREKRLWDLFFNVEMKLLPVLKRMECQGIYVDASKLNEFSATLKEHIHQVEENVWQLAGETFNLGSPMQLAKILYEKLKLPTLKKGKTGFSTDASVLNRLQGKHPIISKLLEHREATKLKSTYVDALPEMIRSYSGRLHTSFSQVTAATGRLSSLSPNLQNIPVRTEHGRHIRSCFVTKDNDKILIAADYSQIELRLLAHLSQDPGLLDAYKNGVDVHARTAAALYGVDEKDVIPEMRRNAKVVNFGVLYGMGPVRLSNQLGITRGEASQFIQSYFANFSKVKEFMENTVETARKKGFVETILGRRRYLPELGSTNRMFRENAERMAVNTPIQGSAADLIKLAMIQIDKKLQSEFPECKMLLQVHDELVFESPEEISKAAGEVIRYEMEHAMELSVPLQVEVGFGKNWVEAH